MTKLARILEKQRMGCVKGIVTWLAMLCLLFCSSVGLADDVDEYLVYSWEVYQAMSMEDKGAFIENFDTPEVFDEWAYLACLFSASIDEEDRALLKHTWAEFESMTNEQQDEFCETLGDYVFETWMNIAQRKPALVPLYIIDPLRCAWVDFEQLEMSQKEAFFECFEKAEDFEAWMQKAQEIPQLPLALVEDYQNCTWAEFSVLSLAQQEAFFDLFEESTDFEQWMGAAQQKMKKVKPNTDLTWEELEAMDIAEKEAFFESFESAEAFEAWMEQAKRQAE